MKILAIAPVVFPVGIAGYSGIERLSGYWAKELDRLGHQVTMVAARGSLLPGGVDFVPVPQGDFTQGELVAYGNYRHYLRDFELILDFSHSHWAMREFSLPAICWVWHDPAMMQPTLPGYNVAALSQWQANHLQIYQNVRARVVDPHCGIGREPVEAKDAFSFVGKMHPTKGALEAIQLCRETTDQLYIIGGAGPGDPPEYLEQVRRECHGLATYWGEVNDPVRDLLLASTKALIYPLAPDYAESHSHKSVDALLCCPKGTLILTPQGWQDICDVKVGNRVLAHNRRYERVSRTFARDYTGPLVRLKCRGNGMSTELTPEHPVLVGTRKKRWKPAMWQSYINQATELHWVAAQDVQVGDWVVTPTMHKCRGIRVLRFRAAPIMERSRSGTPFAVPGQHILPREIEVTGALGRWAGYYIAEGSASGSNISLRFGLQEEDYAQEAAALMTTLFNVPGKVRVSGRGLQVYGVSKRLAPRLRFWFGSGAHHKKIPSWIMRGSEEVRKEFLLGYLRGDGHITNSLAYGVSYIGFNTVSPMLAGQLLILLGRRGILPRIGIVDNNVGFQKDKTSAFIFRGTVQGGHADKLAKLAGFSIGDRKLRRNLTFLWKGLWFTKVTEKTYRDFEGQVFNLEVEHAHSYTANGVVVHNCGCPVISYWRGALPEVIEHRQDGFLARTREEFKIYMKEANTLNRQEIRHRAVERWSIGKVVEKALPLLQEIAGGLRW